MAMSMALLFGCLFLATVHDPSQVRARLAWIANELSAGGRPAELLQRPRSGPRTDPRTVALRPPGSPAAARDRRGPLPRPNGHRCRPRRRPQAGSIPSRMPKANSQSPVAWTLDDRDVQRPVTSPWGFSIGGTNVSDEALGAGAGGSQTGCDNARNAACAQRRGRRGRRRQRHSRRCKVQPVLRGPGRTPRDKPAERS